MKTTLVTGATGFIGQVLVRELKAQGWRVFGLSRHPRDDMRVADLARPETLKGVCTGVDTVFHLAGVAHADAEDPEALEARHRAVTVEGTRILLEDAVAQGARGFVYVSSVKAMGEGGDGCLDESSVAAPQTEYGRARLEAERLVLAAGEEHGLHVSVLRLPPVYGPGHKGNLARLIAGIDRGSVPPLPRTGNRRSLVHVDDVARALMLAAENPAARGQVFIVTDGRAYSTREMYEAIRRELGRPVPAWAVPAWLLRLGAGLGDALQRVTGRPAPLNSGALDKLLGAAWYSSARIRRELGFESRHTFQESLPGIIAGYRQGTGR